VATYLERSWGSNLGAPSRAARRPSVYRPYLPDPLNGREILLPATTAADVADVERAVLELQQAHPGLVNLEALARLLLRAEAVASSFIESLRVNVRRLATEEIAQRSGLGSRNVSCHIAR
jgi:Fic/DOC family N-terminal